MGRLTTDWTDRHRAVAAALTVTGLAGLAGGAQPPAYRPLAAVVIVAAVLVALRLDAFGGIVTGLAAAAAVVAVKQLTGGWTPDAFATSLALTVALLVLGWVTGVVSGRLRERQPKDVAAAGLVAPAHGSLGLITGEVAEARLEEEIARARRHRRPLSLVLLRTRIADEALAEGARLAAYRSVARLVETLLRDTDVPFAFSREEIGAILPETDGDDAWEVVGPLVDAITGATFTDRQEGERRNFADCADLQVGLVTLSREHGSAADLVAAVRRAVVSDDPDSALVPAAGAR